MAGGGAIGRSTYSGGAQTVGRTALGREGGVEAVALTPNGLQHGHTLESPTISQVHNLTAAELQHGHTLGSPSLSQVHNLTANGLQHGHTLGSPSLTENYQLTAEGLQHGHSLASPDLSQVHNLTANGLQHPHTLDQATLSQVYVLEPTDLGHGHTIEAPSLTQAHTLTPAGLQHGHTLDQASLLTDDPGRVTQAGIETFEAPFDGDARLTQTGLEVLRSAGNVSGPERDSRITQLDLEAVVGYDEPAIVTQLTLEVLRDGGNISPCPPVGPRRFYFGEAGGDSIFQFGQFFRDDGSRFRGLIKPNPIAPDGVGGEHLFRNLYLTVTYGKTVRFRVTPVIDGKHLTDETAQFTLFQGEVGHRTETVEIGLASAHSDAQGAQIGRKGVRGTWFTAEIEVEDVEQFCGAIFVDGVEVEYESVREEHPDLPFAESDLAGVTRDRVRPFYFGGGDSLAKFGTAADDLGSPVPFKARTNPVAPAGVGGEAIYPNLYLVVSRNNATDFDLDVTVAVDQNQLTTYTQTLSAVTGAPITEVIEVPLKELTQNARTAPRGTWIEAILESAESIPDGQMVVEGLSLEVEQVRESLPELSYVEGHQTSVAVDRVRPFYFGGGDSLAKFGTTNDDLGAAVPFKAQTNPVAPAGQGGECIFPNLYLTVTRNNPTDFEMDVTVLVDEEPLTTRTLSFDAVTSNPITEVREIGLNELTQNARTAPRGSWIEVRLESQQSIPDGLFVVEGATIEHEIIRESAEAINAGS